MDWRKHIVRDPRIFSGKPTIKGTRISVDLIMTQLGWGMVDADIVEYHYPYLSAEDIEACREYVAAGEPMGCITDPKIDALLAAGNDDCPGSDEPGMGWVGRIVSTPNVLYGRPRIKGTRISVERALKDLKAGYTAEGIIDGYSHLTVEDVAACQEFAATGEPLTYETSEEWEAWMEANEYAERLKRKSDANPG